MWKEMELSHQEMNLKAAGWNKREMERCGFLIEGMVTPLCNRYGCIWTSEDCTDQLYPPPTLLALLMLVLVPCIDNMSVQSIVSTIRRLCLRAQVSNSSCLATLRCVQSQTHLNHIIRSFVGLSRTCVHEKVIQSFGSGVLNLGYV
ncbi:hypothetical protein AMECASPLE_013390 [Ameca splendens]|uniref:Uncharacterized protein n=1 Tax=Ameca splendens TaxID=208324 RepID=A0ABV0Y174_9TELE